MPQLRLHPLNSSVIPPQRMNNPFDYSPHPLCLAAADKAEQHIIAHPELMCGEPCGKMFGVLVVIDVNGKLGFLAAYSGLLGGRNDWEYFVPPVYDAQQPDGVFKTREREITAINHEIERISQSTEYVQARAHYEDAAQYADRRIAEMKSRLAEAKHLRDQRRLSGDVTEEGKNQLIHESQQQKADFNRERKRLRAAVDEAKSVLDAMDGKINSLRRQRHLMSEALQAWLFGQYRMLNAHGQERNLSEIFASTPQGVPPAGAGDCCAPKLLQYAFQHELKPVAMAEFWWGASPKTEVRRHLCFYPACHGKCRPILSHMLQGLDVEPEVLRGRQNKELEIVYEDNDIAVVYKPAGMLSVPGKGSEPSVESILRRRWGVTESPIMPHRLDMDTSGLMVVARTAEAYRALQGQFLRHEVRKHYVALLENAVAPKQKPYVQWDDGGLEVPRSGIISLPIRPDLLDRPRQMADTLHGRQAITRFSLRGIFNGKQVVDLYPQTGRTHQLRVHCAHVEGLYCPIVGDNLYGHKAERLCLHAQTIAFVHPQTGKKMTFSRDADFLKDL